MTVADAETSEGSSFASWLHKSERVDAGTNLLKLVCRVIFQVRAPQLSDVRRNERSKVSKGSFTSTMTSRWRANFFNVSASSFPCIHTWEGIQRKVSWRPRIALYVWRTSATSGLWRIPFRLDCRDWSADRESEHITNVFCSPTCWRRSKASFIAYSSAVNTDALSVMRTPWRVSEWVSKWLD